MITMVLKTFSSLADCTRLIQYKDTVFKVKLCYRNIEQSLRDKEIHAEIEEVLRAVIHILINNEALVKIQTEHFRVIPSTMFWKTGRMLEFFRNGKMLKGYKDVIILTVIPCSLGQGMSVTVPTSSVRMQETPSKASQSENISQNQGKDAQKSNTAGRSETVHNDSSSRPGSSEVRATRFAAINNRSTMDRSGNTQPSSQADTRDTTVASQSSLQAAARQSNSQADGELPILSASPTAVAVRTDDRGRINTPKPEAKSKRRSPDKPSPKLSLRSNHQSESLPASVVELDRNSNIRYGLRTRTQPEMTCPRLLIGSPRKSQRSNLQNPSTNNSNAHASPKKNVRGVGKDGGTGSRDIMSSGAISSDQAQQVQVGSDTASSECEKHGDNEQRHTKQPSALPQASSIGRRTRQQLVFLRSGRATSSTTNSPKRYVLRSPLRSAAMSSPRLGERRPNQLLDQDQTNCSRRTAGETAELRQTVRRGTIAEEQRLRSLAADQNQDQRLVQTRAETFEQKDRHIIESENRLEELKLQTLASSETCHNSKKAGRKRSSGLMELFQDSIVTPIKKALRSTKATS